MLALDPDRAMAWAVGGAFALGCALVKFDFRPRSLVRTLLTGAAIGVVVGLLIGGFARRSKPDLEWVPLLLRYAVGGALTVTLWGILPGFVGGGLLGVLTLWTMRLVAGDPLLYQAALAAWAAILFAVLGAISPRSGPWRGALGFWVGLIAALLLYGLERLSVSIPPLLEPVVYGVVLSVAAAGGSVLARRAVSVVPFRMALAGGLLGLLARSSWGILSPMAAANVWSSPLATWVAGAACALAGGLAVWATTPGGPES
jgi:hypothetical protein